MILQRTNTAILLCLASITLILRGSFTAVAASTSSSPNLRRRKANKPRQRDSQRQQRQLYIHEWQGGFLNVLAENSYISPTDSLSVSFELPEPVDENSLFHTTKAANNSEWRIGIYMHMADPQEGRIRPIVALGLCGKEVCEHDEFKSEESDEGKVTFSENATMTGRGGGWPLDIHKYGTGYDVYIIDDEGAALLGPEPFFLRKEAAENKLR